MASVGLFFGSDTGNTEHVAKMIQKELGKNLIDVQDIAKSTKEQIAEFDLLIFGKFLIFLKHILPGRFTHRRQDAEQRTPFDHR